MSCKNHPTRKLWAKGMCKSCYNSWHLKSDPTRAANKLRQNKEWRKANTEHLKKYRSDKASHISKVQRSRHLDRNYGLTLEAFNSMFLGQGEICAICDSPTPGPRQWHVDHSHSTGLVRGILCHGCNTSLGGFKDSKEILRAAIAYLEKSEQ